jgi:hypothetical protein
VALTTLHKKGVQMSELGKILLAVDTKDRLAEFFCTGGFARNKGLQGHSIRTVRYDRMASFLAPYGNRDALQVAQSLDKKIEDLLRQAAA